MSLIVSVYIFSSISQLWSVYLHLISKIVKGWFPLDLQSADTWLPSPVEKYDAKYLELKKIQLGFWCPQDLYKLLFNKPILNLSKKISLSLLTKTKRQVPKGIIQCPINWCPFPSVGTQNYPCFRFQLVVETFKHT